MARLSQAQGKRGSAGDTGCDGQGVVIMSVITLQQARERLVEVRGRLEDIEENTSRYYELGEWRISGYDNEELYEELQDLEERLIDKIEELEEEEFDE